MWHYAHDKNLLNQTNFLKIVGIPEKPSVVSSKSLRNLLWEFSFIIMKLVRKYEKNPLVWKKFTLFFRHFWFKQISEDVSLDR